MKKNYRIYLPRKSMLISLRKFVKLLPKSEKNPLINDDRDSILNTTYFSRFWQKLQLKDPLHKVLQELDLPKILHLISPSKSYKVLVGKIYTSHVRRLRSFFHFSKQLKILTQMCVSISMVSPIIYRIQLMSKTHLSS